MSKKIALLKFLPYPCTKTGNNLVTKQHVNKLSTSASQMQREHGSTTARLLAKPARPQSDHSDVILYYPDCLSFTLNYLVACSLTLTTLWVWFPQACLGTLRHKLIGAVAEASTLESFKWELNKLHDAHKVK